MREDRALDDVFDPSGAASGGDPAAYETDIFAWSQRQAEVLRSLAHSRRDLPNELDLEHVAEEIEDLGISELRRVETLLRRMLGHGILATMGSKRWTYRPSAR